MYKIPSTKTITVSIAIAVCAYMAMILLSDYRNLLQALQQISMPVMALLVFISLLSYLTRFSRWLVFFQNSSPTVACLQQLPIYLAGFALTTTPAKSGELIRSVFLKRLHIDYSFSMAAFFSERLMDVMAVGLLALLALSALQLSLTQISVVLLIIMGLLIVFRSQLLHQLLQRFSQHKLIDFADHFKTEVAANFSLCVFLKSFPLSLLAWALQGFSLFIITSQLGYDLPLYTLIGVYCFSILAGAASMIPGGLGATEASIAALLILLGVEKGDAIAISIISRMVTLWLAISLGVISMFITAKTLKPSGSQIGA